MYAHACLLVVTHTLLTGTWPHQLAWSVASIVSLRPTQPGEALPLDEPQQELHHLRVQRAKKKKKKSATAAE
jgi:hypothetical protein